MNEAKNYGRHRRNNVATIFNRVEMFPTFFETLLHKTKINFRAAEAKTLKTVFSEVGSIILDVFVTKAGDCRTMRISDYYYLFNRGIFNDIFKIGFD